MFKQSTIFAVAVSVLSISPSLVRAAEPERVSKTVSIADLDLSNDAGRAVLQGRLRRAAEEVCGGVPQGHPGLNQNPQFRTCRDKAMADAQMVAAMAIEAATQRAAKAATVETLADRNIKG
jgi:UrcA family protein